MSGLGGFSFGGGGGRHEGLVLRAGAVEAMALRAGRVVAQASVPVEGKGELGISQAVEKALAASGIRSKRLAIAILTPDIVFRSFSMPSVPKSEIERAVQFEVRKYIPYKTETLVWDYRVLPTTGPQAGRTEVVFVAMQKEAFAGTLSALAAAGIQPTGVEPLSLSLARLVQKQRSGAAGAYQCVVDIERTSAHVAIVRDGVPMLSRDVALVGRAGSGESTTDDGRLQRLASELSVSIDFFLREHPGASVSQAWLFGDDAVADSWGTALSAQLRMPVSGGRAVLGVAAQGAASSGMAAGVGLLLERARGGCALDLLRQAAVRSGAARPVVPAMPTTQEVLALLKTPQASVVAGGLIAALALVWLLGAQQIDAKRRQLQALQAARVTIGYGVDGMTHDALEPMVGAARERLHAIRQVVDRPISVARQMDALARALPDGVWFTSLTLDNRLDPAGAARYQWDLKGACYLGEATSELNAIQELERRVRQSPALTPKGASAQVERIMEAASAEGTYRTFNLTCGAGGTS